MTPNRLLFDFYLNLLAINTPFRDKHEKLYTAVATAIAIELDEDVQTVQGIFERMAREDSK